MPAAPIGAGVRASARALPPPPRAPASWTARRHTSSTSGTRSRRSTMSSSAPTSAIGSAARSAAAARRSRRAPNLAIARSLFAFAAGGAAGAKGWRRRGSRGGTGTSWTRSGAGAATSSTVGATSGGGLVFLLDEIGKRGRDLAHAAARRPAPGGNFRDFPARTRRLVERRDQPRADAGEHRAIDRGRPAAVADAGRRVITHRLLRERAAHAPAARQRGGRCRSSATSRARRGSRPCAAARGRGRAPGRGAR